MNNRIWNSRNPHQGSRKKVLCVCSAGLLRSPTTANILAQEPFNCNTRAAGIADDFALIVVDDVLVAWADEIVCMEELHEIALKTKFPNIDKPVHTLNIPDNFSFMDNKLQQIIRKQVSSIFVE